MAEVMEKTSLDPKNLPGNSFSEKEKKGPGKVIQGQAITRKKSFGRRMADLFIGENVGDVKTYILEDVLVPTIKATISDIIGGGVDMLLFPGQSRGRRSVSRSNINYTPYNSLNNRGAQPTSYQDRVAPRYGVDEIILGTRGEADDVLAAMSDYMHDYGMVAVADLYEMVGHPIVFTDNNWGWSDLRSASVRKIPEGYLLVLPRPMSLK